MPGASRSTRRIREQRVDGNGDTQPPGGPLYSRPGPDHQRHTGPRRCINSSGEAVHDLPDDSLSNVAGDSNYVRVQVLTPTGVLDRDKQLGVVKELTEIVATAAEDPTLGERTWVLITESPEGGWGINGHANTSADITAAARAELAALAAAKAAEEPEEPRRRIPGSNE